MLQLRNVIRVLEAENYKQPPTGVGSTGKKQTIQLRPTKLVEEEALCLTGRTFFPPFPRPYCFQK